MQSLLPVLDHLLSSKRHLVYKQKLSKWYNTKCRLMVLCYKPCLSLQAWSDHVISLPPRLLPEKTKKHLSSFGLHALMAWLQLRSAAKLPWRSCCIHSENVTSHGSRKVPRLCHHRPEVVNRCPHLSSLWLEMDQKSSHQIVWHQSPNVHDIFQLLTANSWFLSTSTNQLIASRDLPTQANNPKWASYTSALAMKKYIM